MNIVAIGGGELKDRETLPIDRHIVDLAGKRAPKALFIPTASGDALGYCASFDAIYGGELGCKPYHLLLYSHDKDPRAIEEKILGADIIYVGGGNTLRMMKLWRRHGVDSLLRAANGKGTILAGLSAGAICWHQWGHSDSQSFSQTSNWAYIRVKGLGLSRGIFCPHLDKENRHLPFLDMIERRGGLGIACDNNAAICYTAENQATVLTASKKARVCLYRRHADKVEITEFHDGYGLNLA